MTTLPLKHPDASLPPNVHVLRPDGVTIRTDSPRHWIGKRRNGHPLSETAYDMGELLELREVLNRYLSGFEEP